MKKEGKLITLVLKIVNEKDMDPLWEAPMKRIPILGCNVLAMGWGSAFGEMDLLESRYNASKKLLERNSDYKGLEALERLERIHLEIIKRVHT